MDETIKIYPAVTIKTESTWNDTEDKAFITRSDIWKDIVNEREGAIRNLQAKYPWVPLFYNWLIAALILLLGFSFIWWGLSVNAKNQAAADYDAAVQTFYREQEEKARDAQAALEEAQKSEQELRKKDIELMAKFLEGLSGFVKNRGYTSVDLYTYAQCPINRMLNPAFWVSTLEEALNQEDQWVGFSHSNQVTAENEALATRIINELYDGETRPCGYEYCWTEFTDKGLYLKSDFGPATFNNTWRAKG